MSTEHMLLLKEDFREMKSSLSDVSDCAARIYLQVVSMSYFLVTDWLA